MKRSTFTADWMSNQCIKLYIIFLARPVGLSHVSDWCSENLLKYADINNS